MKRTPILFLLLVGGIPALAEWQAVNAGLGSMDVRSIFAFEDTLVVGTASGIFRNENSTTWSAINGNIGNTSIRDVRGGGGPRVIWASTDSGGYFSLDQQMYTPCATTGPATGPVNYYWFGFTDNDESAWVLGTEGAGVLVGPELDGPWTAANNGLSGDALYVNDFTGYEDDELDYIAIATDAGVYVSTDGLASWQGINGGLSGSQLVVHRIVALGGLVFACTDGGLLATPDFGLNWYTLTGNPGAILAMGVYPMSGMALAFGDGAYQSTDFFTYNPLEMDGIGGGPVTCVALTSTHVYVGTRTGGVFREEIQFLSDIVPGPLAGPRDYRLLGNFPNPFNPATRIDFTLAHPGMVRILVHDLLGREVHVFDQGSRSAGPQGFTFDASALPSGTYSHHEPKASGIPAHGSTMGGMSARRYSIPPRAEGIRYTSPWFNHGRNERAAKVSRPDHKTRMSLR
jgi:hypothetical protein